MSATAVQSVAGQLVEVSAAELVLGDTVLIEGYLGRVVMLDTYNLGGAGGVPRGSSANWPCIRVYIDWGTSARGFARFPYERVSVVRT